MYQDADVRFDAPGGTLFQFSGYCEAFNQVPSDAARTNTRRIFVARAAVQELREG